MGALERETGFAGAVGNPGHPTVIAVPAAQVLEAAEQCGRKGVRALVVISAGFSETGEEGPSPFAGQPRSESEDSHEEQRPQRRENTAL